MPELADLEDPRAVNARLHSRHDILVIALCTIVCGGQTCTDMELFGQSKREFPETFLPLPNGIPSHDTFSRVLGMLDPEAFHRKLSKGGFCGSWRSSPKVVRVWWRWTARRCGVLTTAPKANRRCIW